MKLLFCPKCHDVKKLQYKLRECKCGASWGWYKKDGLNAVIGGECVPLGIDNRDFVYAVKHLSSWGGKFKAFVIPPSSKTVKRQGSSPKESDEPPSTQ